MSDVTARRVPFTDFICSIPDEIAEEYEQLRREALEWRDAILNPDGIDIRYPNDLLERAMKAEIKRLKKIIAEMGKV